MAAHAPLPGAGEADLAGLGGARPGRRQVAGGDHVGQHLGGAFRRAARVGQRVVPGRRLEKPGQHGGLVGGNVAGRLGEVPARRRLDAEGAGAQIDPVEIDREDLRLGEPVLQPQRQQQLLDLAFEGAPGRQEQVLRHLLGDGAAALDDGAGAQVGESGARQADHVEPEMAVEAPVLGGQHGLGQGRRQVFEAHRRAVEVAEFGQDRAVGGDDGHRRPARGGQRPVHVGQVVGVPRDHGAEADDPPHGHGRRPPA